MSDRRKSVVKPQRSRAVAQSVSAPRLVPKWPQLLVDKHIAVENRKNNQHVYIILILYHIILI